MATHVDVAAQFPFFVAGRLQGRISAVAHESRQPNAPKRGVVVVIVHLHQVQKDLVGKKLFHRGIFRVKAVAARNSDEGRKRSDVELREMPTDIDARVEVDFSVHRVVRRQIQHLLTAQTCHQFQRTACQRPFQRFLGVKRQGAMGGNVRQPALTRRNAWIERLSGVEHLSVAEILVQIPVDAQQKAVRQPARRHLETGVGLEKEVQRLAIDLVVGGVFIR